MPLPSQGERGSTPVQTCIFPFGSTFARTHRFIDGIGNGLGMYLAGKMNRTLAMDGIPAGRIGRAEKLGFNAHLASSILYRSTDDPQGRFPGSRTGGTPYNPDIRYSAILYFNLVFRSAKSFPIFTQADLPGKAASGRRRKHPFTGNFLSRGDDGNVLVVAERHEIMGEVFMFEKIKYQIGVKLFRKILTAIFNNRRQRDIYRYHFQLYGAFGVLTDTGNFFFTAAMLLKHCDFLFFIQKGIIVFRHVQSLFR